MELCWDQDPEVIACVSLSNQYLYFSNFCVYSCNSLCVPYALVLLVFTNLRSYSDQV